MKNIITVITYDFYYNADNTPWFCSLSTSVSIGDELVHSQMLQSDSLYDFERMRKDAIADGFKMDFEYTNPANNVRGETYRKIFGIE